MRIQTSKRSAELLTTLTNYFPFETESITARVGFMYSLQRDIRFSEPFPAIDRLGKDFLSASNLFGKNSITSTNYVLYRVILNQHYDRNLTDEEFFNAFSLHLEEGLSEIDKNTPYHRVVTGEHIDYLLSIIREGTDMIYTDSSPQLVTEGVVTGLPETSAVAQFDLGLDTKGQPVTIRLNDLKQFDSHHIAISGMNGSGKTELLKDILYQITKSTNEQLKFIFFDYKGVGDPSSIKSFLDATNCHFVEVSQPLEYELNPMEFILPNNENQIISFVSSITAITNLGPVQEMTLRTIIRTHFEQEPKFKLTLGQLYNLTIVHYEQADLKPDKLISILDTLAATKPFSEDPTGGEVLFDKSLYLNLPPAIPDQIRQLVVFLTLRYVLEKFGNSTDTVPNANYIKPLRYIVIVDEAHIYLKNAKANKILQLLLQTMRSKGVVVIMLTQEVTDFRTGDYDFASQIKIPIALNVNDKSLKNMKRFLGTPKSEVVLEDLLKELRKGYGVVNFNDPELIKINQFYARDLQ